MGFIIILVLLYVVSSSAKKRDPAAEKQEIKEEAPIPDEAVMREAPEDKTEA